MPSLHAVELRRVSPFPALSVAVLFVMVLAGDHMVEGTEDGWVQKIHVEAQVGIGAMSPRLVTVGLMCQ